MNIGNINESPILEELEQQISREISSLHNPLHIWWARLPSVTARTAVYANLVPQSEETAQVLGELGRHPISEETTARAVHSIVDEFRSERKKSSAQDRPRLLDPFSGSGSIPLAASILGVEAHAVDINPVAYVLQLCRLTFPQRFGKPDQQLRGISKEGGWAGLSEEVLYWTEWLDEQVRAEISYLFPPLENERADSSRIVQAYFWSFMTKCQNPSCGVQFPLINFPYLVKNSERSLAFQPRVNETSGTVSVSITEDLDQGAFKTVERGGAICPICGTKKTLGEDSLGAPQLLAVRANTDSTSEYVAQNLHKDVLPNDVLLTQRIEALLQETSIPPLEEELPEIYADRRYGFDTYSTIFTKRQLLFLLTVAKYIPLAHGQMLSRRYETERAAAVATYLGLFLSNLVNYHNRHCRWQAVTEQPQPIFIYQTHTMVWTYVEMNPFATTKSLRAYAERLTRTIEANAKSGSPAHVLCTSATALPYPDGYFDGIVTAAPYYDLIPYADLSDLYFTWLKRSIGHLYPREFGSDVTRKTEEIIVARGNGAQQDVASYRDKLSRALAEVERVLKPGNFFTMIVPTSKADVLQDFLELTQAAGLELVDVKRVRTTRAKLGDDSATYQALLTFKKSKLVQHASQVLVDAATVLKLADEGEPSLCSGLAQLLMDHLEDDDLEHLVPVGYQGSLKTRLIEFVNRCENPGDLLDELGRSTLRQVAREKGLPEESGDAKDLILKSFGFNVPEPEQTGIEALIRDLPRLNSKVKLASSKGELRGLFLTAVTQFESIIKRAIWAWSEIIFTVERDTQLEDLAGKGLGRLSMGDYQRLFLTLPDHVVSQGFDDHVEKILHRRHLYSTKKLTPRLDNIVALRNRIEHDKDGYFTQSPIEGIRADMETCLDEIGTTLNDVKKRGAIPLVARPVCETIDVFGRRSYELKVEDGTVKEIYMTKDLALGRDYYYFEIKSNPRPADPPMLLVSSVLEELP